MLYLDSLRMRIQVLNDSRFNIKAISPINAGKRQLVTKQQQLAQNMRSAISRTS